MRPLRVHRHVQAVNTESLRLVGILLGEREYFTGIFMSIHMCQFFINSSGGSRSCSSSSCCRSSGDRLVVVVVFIVVVVAVW